MKKNVLYVEEDTDLQLMVKTYLEYEGYKCLISNSIDDAIKVLGTEKVDVIMTSLSPAKSITLHSWCRKENMKHSFILLTGYAPETKKMLDADEDTYLLVKPFKMIDILKLISG